MTLRVFFLASLALLLAQGQAQAQQYRWIDRDGKVQFSDAPPPPGAKDVRKIGGAAAAGAQPSMPYEVARLQADFPVTLYTSPSCKLGCQHARDALNRRAVPFKEVQVWNAETIAELKRASGGEEVPALIVGREAQRGFEQGAYDLLLDSAGYPREGLLPPLSQKAPPPPEGYATEQPKPAAAAPAQATEKPGPYDTSRLQGPPPRTGPYGIPGESK
jgi:glutaredoxin